jgi:hypothetical protein
MKRFPGNLFESQDSIYSLKTALLITLVPVLLLGTIIYSVWLLLALNHSYFIANGFPIDDDSRQNFLMYLLQSQSEYLPHIGMFFVSVFFLGVFLSYIVLRPFNQLKTICEGVVSQNAVGVKVEGLDGQKLLIKLGNFLADYAVYRKEGKLLSIPREFDKVKGPALDWVFYFQFFCLIAILMAVTVTTIHIFTHQLHDSIVQTAVTMLKAPKGAEIFLSSQEDVINLITLVPSVLGCVLYGIIGRKIISKIEGVTYAYVRDVREMANGNYSRRLHPRSDDPGKHAAEAVNELLDNIHPAYARVKTLEEKGALGLVPGGVKT